MQTTNTSYMAVFEPGTNPRERCFEYPILRDQLAEGSETFKLYAQQVGNGADVTFVTQQVNVTIQDADGESFMLLSKLILCRSFIHRSDIRICRRSIICIYIFWDQKCFIYIFSFE